MRQALGFLVLGWLSLAILGCSSAQPGAQPQVSLPPPVVEVVRPARRTVSRTLELPGDVRPYQEARIYAKVAGYLSQVQVDTGDRVQAGDLLAVLTVPELEPRLAQAQHEAVAVRAEASEAGISRAQAQAAEEAAAAGLDKAAALRREAEAALRQAHARQRLYQDSYDRLKRVFDQDAGLLARQELDQALAQVEEGEAAVEAARQRVVAALHEVDAARARRQVAGAEIERTRARVQVLSARSLAREDGARQASIEGDYSRIRAPFAGVVTMRHLDPGALVQNAATSAQNQTRPILELSDSSRVRVVVQVPEAEVRFVRPGTPATLAGPGLESPLGARVTRTSESLDRSTRSMVAEIELDNARQLLKPGMFLTVGLELERRPDALSLPVGALIAQKDKRFVLLVEDGQARKVQVKTGYEGTQWVEITGGLTGTEQVITEGKEGVSPGQGVEIHVPGG